MENQKSTIWGKVIQIIITVLTAIATTFGIQSCLERSVLLHPIKSYCFLFSLKTFNPKTLLTLINP